MSERAFTRRKDGEEKGEVLRHRFVGDDGGTFPEADKREPWMRLLFRATHQLSSDLISVSPSVQRDLLPRPYFFVFSHMA